MSEQGGTPKGEQREGSIWEQVRELLERVERSSVTRLRVESEQGSVEIEREAHAPAPSLPAPAAAPSAEGGAIELDGRHAVVAPLVGTFYRAPQPGADPFVEEGDVVEEGQTLAILEAMKLMNEVKADRRGRVIEIVTANGEWVEFEQVLMYLEPAE